MTDPSLSKYVRVDTTEPVVDRIWHNVAKVRARDQLLHTLRPVTYGGGLCLALLGVFGGVRLLSSEPRRDRPRVHVEEEPVAGPRLSPTGPVVAAPPPGTGPIAPAGHVESIPEGKLLAVKQGDAGARFHVTPEGRTYVLGRRGAAEVKPEQVKGKLFVRKLPDGPVVEHALAPKDGRAFADVGKLDGPLTEMRYQLAVDGAPVEGALVLPKGGTGPIVEQAHAAAKVPVKPGTKGPHGGIVQPVGGKLYEIAGKKGSGEIRAYPLDDKLKPRKIVGSPNVKVALTSDGPAPHADVVALAPAPSGDYLVGTAPLQADPKALTLVVEDGGPPDVVLVGYHPGAVIVVGPAAPVVLIFVVTTWDVVIVDPLPAPIIVIEKPHHWKGKGKHWHRRR